MSLNPRQDELYRVLGRRIRRIREDGGITQDDLASAVGLSRTSITNLELGRQKPPLHVLFFMAEKLDAELKELIPLRQELAGPSTTVVTVNGRSKEVPTATAHVIESLLRKGASE